MAAAVAAQQEESGGVWDESRGRQQEIAALEEQEQVHTCRVRGMKRPFVGLVGAADSLLSAGARCRQRPRRVPRTPARLQPETLVNVSQAPGEPQAGASRAGRASAQVIMPALTGPPSQRRGSPDHPGTQGEEGAADG